MKGWKTWTATIGYAVCEVVKTAFPDYYDAADTLQKMIFVPLGVVGVAHKMEKKQ